MCVFVVLQVSYKEPTPPDTELVVRSHVVAVRENQNPGLGKAAVEVDVAILLPQADGSEKLLVQVRDDAARDRIPACAMMHGGIAYQQRGGCTACGTPAKASLQNGQTVLPALWVSACMYRLNCLPL